MTARSMSRACVLALCSVLMLLLASPARAEQYRYSFLTDPFTVNGFYPRANPGPQNWTFEDRLLVSVYTDALLTGPVGEADIQRFEMTLLMGNDRPTGGGGRITMGSPFPAPGWECCDVYTEYTWNMSIGSLDANGLPATWDIRIDRFQINPITTENFGMVSSNGGTAMSRGADTYFSENGSVTHAPGTLGGVWTVAAVPEPESYALMLAGAIVVGVMARRRARRIPAAADERIA